MRWGRDPELIRTLSRLGRRVSIYHFPPYPAGGPNGGHWAAFIHAGDEVVFASPHERRYVESAMEWHSRLRQISKPRADPSYLLPLDRIAQPEKAFPTAEAAFVRSWTDAR